MTTPTNSVRFYDMAAWFYDLVVGSDLYHRFVWGMPVLEHARFAQLALNAADPGPILDAGCGSMLFTASSYRATGRALTCLDASQSMLQRARRRLGQLAQRMRWLCDDLYALPVGTEAMHSVFHFGVLHCLENPELALAEQARVLRPGGQLYLSCLVLGRSRGDRFLERLHRAGHVAAPRSAEQVEQLVRRAGFALTRTRTHGSFLFVEARRP